MKLGQLFFHWDQIHQDTPNLLDRFSQAEMAYVRLKEMRWADRPSYCWCEDGLAQLFLELL
jgi:hypothetical protein